MRKCWISDLVKQGIVWNTGDGICMWNKREIELPPVLPKQLPQTFNYSIWLYYVEYFSLFTNPLPVSITPTAASCKLLKTRNGIKKNNLCTLWYLAHCWAHSIYSGNVCWVDKINLGLSKIKTINVQFDSKLFSSTLLWLCSWNDVGGALKDFVLIGHLHHQTKFIIWE